MAGRVVVVTGATGGLGGAVATALAGLRCDGLAARTGPGPDLDAAARSVAAAPGADLNAVGRPGPTVRRPRGRGDLLGGIRAPRRVDPQRRRPVPAIQLTVDGLEVTRTGTRGRAVPADLAAIPRLSRRRRIAGDHGLLRRDVHARLDVDALNADPAAFDGVAAYASPSAPQVVLTQEWARRTADSGVAFHVTHPGWVDTPGLRASLPRFARLMGPLLRSPGRAPTPSSGWPAHRLARTAVAQFWHDRRPRSTVRLPWTATPEGAADRLWEWTCAHARSSTRRPAMTRCHPRPATASDPRHGPRWWGAGWPA